MSNQMTISEMARQGGIARAKKLTKKQRIDIARKAGSAPKKARVSAKVRKNNNNKKDKDLGKP